MGKVIGLALALATAYGVGVNIFITWPSLEVNMLVSFFVGFLVLGPITLIVGENRGWL